MIVMKYIFSMLNVSPLALCDLALPIALCYQIKRFETYLTSPFKSIPSNLDAPGMLAS